MAPNDGQPRLSKERLVSVFLFVLFAGNGEHRSFPGQPVLMEQASHFIAVLSCLLFTGAAIYINLVEHPARMSCGAELAATVFAPSYKRAVPLQVSLALVATVAGLSSWLHNGEILWLAGALLIFLVIPFTLLVIMPTNKALLAPELNRRSATSLLKRWGKLHGVRSLLALVASCLFLALAIGA